MEVNSKPFELFNDRRSYYTNNCLKDMLYKHSSQTNKGKFFPLYNSQKFGVIDFEERT